MAIMLADITPEQFAAILEVSRRGWARMEAETPTPASESEALANAAIGVIRSGKITKPDLGRMRTEIDKATAPPTGRAAQDAAIGRAIR